MPEFEPVPPAHVSAIERPSCPKCGQRRMLLSKLRSGPCGSATHTFECRKCGYIRNTVIPSDPMTSDVPGWLASELRPRLELICPPEAAATAFRNPGPISVACRISASAA